VTSPAVRFDLVLTGGHVIDPAAGVDGRRDVAFSAGRVVAIESALPAGHARETVDVVGSYVVPGLIDLHAHAFIAGHDLGVETDAVCRSTGVTTLCDAGSTGGANFAGLREYVMARAETRVLGFVHLSAIGLTHLGIGEHCLLEYSDPDLAAAVAREHRDVVLGIKVREQVEVVGAHGLEPLRRGLKAAETAGVPVIVHVNNPPAEYGDVLALLRPGDIVSHFFHGRGSGILDAAGRIKPAVHEARRRGVVFDVAHGRNHVNFPVVRQALAEGFYPDTISSDLTRPGRATIVRDLPTTLSKFLSLGMPLADVVRAATGAPARAIGRSGELGCLAPGAAGDAAVFVVEEGRFPYQDADGNTLEGRYRWTPRLTVRAGRVWWRA
jgi:dihydroorotase